MLVKLRIVIKSLIVVSAILSILYLSALIPDSKAEDTSTGTDHNTRAFESVESEPVDDATMVSVLVVKLRGITREDHVVMDDGSLFLLVPREVFERLPKRINQLTIKRYTGPTGMNEKNDVSFLTFRGWMKKIDSVRVISEAYFVGGNTGGCHERFDRTAPGNWVRVESKCFASAS